MNHDIPDGTTGYAAPPSYLEKVQSQLPALQLLIQMGWEYLSPAEVDALRGGRLGGVILEPVLTGFMRERDAYDFKGSTHRFTENAIESAVQALKGFRAGGAATENAAVYDRLCLGKDVPQTVEGDTKSFTLQYIDWRHPERNRYHCTAEFRVERLGQDKHCVADIVLFVDGIPLVVIECKRSAYPNVKVKPVDVAIRQLADYQARDGIPQLFLYSQMLLALARDKAEFGTAGSPREFWSAWREEGLDAEIRPLLARKLPRATIGKLSEPPFLETRDAFLELLVQGREVYEQDRALYALCRPERLLELAYQFIVYDDGQKKIARYQQYFTVRDILARVLSGPAEAPRPGGVVWHTQGSGKSLTMVMLAKALALCPRLLSPKIVLVTDRVDLDDQLWGTFQACGMMPEQANTGRHLVELLRDDGAHVVTTLIHKFAAAAASRELRTVGRNTFVLVDEGHRSQYRGHHAHMRLALKRACFVAFTGTPLAKSAKRNTFVQFGELFTPPYTIARAVADKAVVPLLYEARHVPQAVERAAIDGWFEKLTAGLTESQRADLKRKFSTETQLNKALHKVRMVAWDVSVHYSTTLQGTGLKGQLVTPDKLTALRYKRFLDEFGMVRSEVLISGPGEPEGDEEDNGQGEADGGDDAAAAVAAFWDATMARYGTEKQYNKLLINAFKRGDEPEIIIVVDKLITGFDAPCNGVLYLARRLREHTLLQAIARVNRLHPGKDYGLILDYSGVIQELDEAIDFYAQLADYDRADLDQTVLFIRERVMELPRLHAALWELFRPVRGAKDPEAYEVHLRDEALRHAFYERFSDFARVLSLALSSTPFLEATPPKLLDRYRDDLKFFQNLRVAVAQRYQESVSFSDYEPRIRKLLDTHVGAGEVQQLCEPIDLFDATARQEVLADQGKSVGAKADMIAAATRHVIEHEMAKDPAFYKRFSKLLEEALEAYHAGRLAALEALKNITEISANVVSHTDDQVPPVLAGQDMARRFYGCVCEPLAPYTTAAGQPAAEIAMEIVKRIGRHKIRDWQGNPDALNRMRGDIDDILFEMAARQGLSIPVELHDAIIDRCIEVAIANEE